MLRVKRVQSTSLRNEVYSLRYRAYRKEDAIDVHASEAFEDQYDHMPNHILFALMHENKVVGSIRTTWFDPNDQHPIPEMHAYSDRIEKVIPSNARILSGNRLVIDPHFSSNRTMVMLLLRHFIISASAVNADWIMAAVRRNHLPFYRRVFFASVVSESRIYPGLRCPMQLIVSNFHTNAELIKQKTPVLQPRGYETMLFDKNRADFWEIGFPAEEAV
jgi:N-acyl-L-homoserine lactone synthetase